MTVELCALQLLPERALFLPLLATAHAWLALACSARHGLISCRELDTWGSQHRCYSCASLQSPKTLVFDTKHATCIASVSLGNQPYDVPWREVRAGFQNTCASCQC